jgi:hypothetical protein
MNVEKLSVEEMRELLARFKKGPMPKPEKEKLFEENPKFKEMNDEYGDVVKDLHKQAADDEVDAGRVWDGDTAKPDNSPYYPGKRKEIGAPPLAGEDGSPQRRKYNEWWRANFMSKEGFAQALRMASLGLMEIGEFEGQLKAAAGPWVGYVEDKDGNMIRFFGPSSRSAITKSLHAPDIQEGMDEKGWETVSLGEKETERKLGVHDINHKWFSKLPAKDKKALEKVLKRLEFIADAKKQQAPMDKLHSEILKAVSDSPLSLKEYSADSKLQSMNKEWQKGFAIVNAPEDNETTEVAALVRGLKKIQSDAIKYLQSLGGKKASDDEKDAKFEKGKPADPTENMSPEDAKKWKEENEKNRDKFKTAGKGDYTGKMFVTYTTGKGKKKKEGPMDISAAKKRFADLMGDPEIKMIGYERAEEWDGSTTKKAKHVRLDQKPPQVLPLAKAKEMAKTLQKSDPEWEYRVVPHGAGKAIIEVYEGKTLVGKWAKDADLSCSPVADTDPDVPADDENLAGRTWDGDKSEPDNHPYGPGKRKPIGDPPLAGQDGSEQRHRYNKWWKDNFGKQANRIRMTARFKAAGYKLYALVYGDGSLYGATTDRRGGDSRYWKGSGATKPGSTWVIYELANVPEDLAEKLIDQGTAAQFFRDGYSAWDAAKKYVKGWVEMDEDLLDNASDLSIHGLRNVKMASQGEVVGTIPLSNKGEPTQVEGTPVTAAIANGLYGYTKALQNSVEASVRKIQRKANRLAKQIYTKDQRVSEFLSTHAKRTGSVSAKVLVAAMKDLGPKFASEEKPAEIQKEAAAYGLYGYARKTADLGVNACGSLKGDVGHIASDLHKRKAALHEQVTGFLKQHSRAARCSASKMLLTAYPDISIKLASTPQSVSEWLSVDFE